MNVSDAMELVDDDLPDGAYWAIVSEMSGVEYGELGAALANEPKRKSRCAKKSYSQPEAQREAARLNRSEKLFKWGYRFCTACQGHHIWRDKQKP